MPKPRFLHPTWLSLLLTAILVLGGCDTTIEPFTQKGSFSIYGFLDNSRDRQLIRVKPLTVPVSKVDSHSFDDATVILENLTAGTSEVLQDSIITYKDDESTVLTHNFWTDTPVMPGTKYRLSVESPEGPSVEAETTTPTATDPVVYGNYPGDTFEIAGCRDRITVEFREVGRLANVRTSLEIKLEEHPQKDPWVSIPVTDDLHKRGPDDVTIGFTAGSLVASLNRNIESLNLQRPELPDSLNPFCWTGRLCALLDSDQVRIRYRYLGPDWLGTLPETFDPLQSFDVRNGIGFFGSVRRDRVSTTVDTSRFVFTGGRLCDESPPDSF